MTPLFLLALLVGGFAVTTAADLAEAIVEMPAPWSPGREATLFQLLPIAWTSWVAVRE